jgi:hypothetical protein
LTARTAGPSPPNRSEGVVLTATSVDPTQVVKIRSLGFMGIMVRGAHHQPHHLAMARGAFPH